MKSSVLLIALLLSTVVFAQQHTPLPHGMVYGKKPDTLAMMSATKLETFMGKKTRISTTIEGRVIKVIHEKGGWFELDAGSGKVIAAHFKDYNINIPGNLAGRTVIIEGVAQKQFIADDLQHLAGDTVTGKKQHQVKTDTKRKVTFEVKGLQVAK
ncbi:DUF4920 domain-containing protein [Mucilaginibacter sp. SG564]|uniref:DUF4920 domain-containing protein n=1 Tax=unclassified Mucilaginibacter TaxID=2617802 RepID=UPI0015573B82|nr:DUF4920 domain-containing protein [Mucilaginibacter sp. SG564]NOW98306.1 hypothetical protein [Mucilaginibacter sp. SG564]